MKGFLQDLIDSVTAVWQNPLYKDLGGAIGRAAMVALGGYLAKKGLAPAGIDPTTLASGIVLFAAGVLWSAFRKYQARQKLTTALANAHPISEVELVAQIKAGAAAPVASPTNVVPIIVPSP